MALEAQNSALANRVEALESGNSNSKRTASVYAEEFSLVQTDMVKTSRKTKRMPSPTPTSSIAADRETRTALKVEHEARTARLESRGSDHSDPDLDVQSGSSIGVGPRGSDRDAKTALAFKLFVPLLIAVLLVLMALNMCGEKGEPCVRIEETEPVEAVHTTALDDLVSDMGVSGLCFLDLGMENAHGGYHLITVVTLAAQSFFLQGTILYFLFTSILEPPTEAQVIEEETEAAGFFIMVYVAVYIHVDSLMRDIAVVLPVLAHAPSLQKGMLAKAFVCIVTAIDGIVIPLATLFIGGLFIMLESNSPADLILNVVAITWIPTIDDEIFALNTKLDNMNGVNICEGASVNLPLHTGYLKFVKTTLGTVPVVPILVSFAMLHVGTVMELA